MKKITLLLIIIMSAPVFAQSDMTIYFQKNEPISIEQYDFIKEVNKIHPDILVTKEVKNNYMNNLKVQQLIDSNLIYEIPAKFKYYFVTMLPGSFSLSYYYKLSENDATVSGDIRMFDGKIVRTTYTTLKDTRMILYYVDGKLINEVKNF